MRFQTLSEARWILLVLAVLALVSLAFTVWLFLLFVLLIGYTFYFFRDPERSIPADPNLVVAAADGAITDIDRKSTRLNSSHANISYAVFCLKKKKKQIH